MSARRNLPAPGEMYYMADEGLTIYSVGHSNVPVAHLAALLAAHGVRVLVDVRSSPYAKYADQFNREALQANPELHGVRYLYAGHLLGGRPDNPVFYDEEGYVKYDDLAASYTFEEGLFKLLDVARKAPTAIMCSEEDPTECHRRLLIARMLDAEGVTVLHLRGDGRVQTEADLHIAETAGQLALGLEEERPWRSTRSALPGKALSDSSDF
jgi:uncharacterized protein (DUF488 family)